MRKKQKKALKNFAVVSLAIILLGTAFYFSIYQSVIGLKPKYDWTYANLLDENNQGATYEFGFDSNDPTETQYIYKTWAIGCGSACSYDYAMPWHPSSQSATPPNVEGLIEGEWFEGEVTSYPQLGMVENYASDNVRTIPMLINNTRVYFMKDGDTYIQRHTGDIYSVDPNKGGHIYGLVIGSGIATIPKEGYLEEPPITTNIEIKDEVTNKDVIDFDNTIVDGQEYTNLNKTNTILNVIVGIVFLIIVIVFAITMRKNGKKKK